MIPWEVRYRIAVGIARALDYLHDGCPRPVVHRDVKASNILLSTTFDAQVSINDQRLKRSASVKSYNVLRKLLLQINLY